MLGLLNSSNERIHRLPHCIFAIGSVPQNTAPQRRLITDARPINKYATRWRVRYTTVLEICLVAHALCSHVDMGSEQCLPPRPPRPAGTVGR